MPYEVKSPCSSYVHKKIANVPLVNHTNVPLSPKIQAFIEECVKLCQPNDVHICDGSLQENEQMLKILEARGTIEKLPKYENWYV